MCLKWVVKIKSAYFSVNMTVFERKIVFQAAPAKLGCLYVQYWRKNPHCICKNCQSNQAINLANTGSEMGKRLVFKFSRLLRQHHLPRHFHRRFQAA